MQTDQKITVLMYHRINAVDTDPWGICVAPQLFTEQIAYLTGHYPVLSIADAIQQLTTGTLQQHSLCITFDDGYVDNFIHAKPILEQYNCPATFFIPTAFMGASTPFWWDELEYLFLHHRQLPHQLEITVDGKACYYKISDAALTDSQWQQHQAWHWYDDPPTDRCTIFLAVWESLRPLPLPTIQEHLKALRIWADAEVPTDFRLPMKPQQLQWLVNNPLFSAGLHTHTHPDLSVHNEEAQTAEIVQNKNLLQSEYGMHTSCLAYPYGRYTEATIAAAKALNLSACFTTDAMPVTIGSNLHRLGRYQVNNWTPDEMAHYLHL